MMSILRMTIIFVLNFPLNVKQSVKGDGEEREKRGNSNSNRKDKKKYCNKFYRHFSRVDKKKKYREIIINFPQENSIPSRPLPAPLLNGVKAFNDGHL